jgi:hypothetical protein
MKRLAKDYMAKNLTMKEILTCANNVSTQTGINI